MARVAVRLPGLIRALAARVRAALRPALVPAVVAAVLLGLLAGGALPYRPARVEGDSMLPTLAPGDRVLVEGGAPARGDVVTAVPPGSDGEVVKRVVAVAGDRVALEDGVLVVNGVAVPEPYADRHGTDGEYAGPLTVPPGSAYLLGDRRGTSVDSRAFGPVPVGDLLGRVVLRVWPGPGPVR